jgi:inosine triphosphate pyrophosphatase
MVCGNGFTTKSFPSYNVFFLIGVIGLNSMLQGFSSKEATALCTFAYCEPGREPILFEGATEGKIVPPRGPANFGWDPIFEVAGTGLT